MSLQSYKGYKKKRIEKNALYTNVVRLPRGFAERIDETPVLKDYIKSKVSEPPEELFFFNSAHLDR